MITIEEITGDVAAETESIQEPAVVGRPRESERSLAERIGRALARERHRRERLSAR